MKCAIREVENRTCTAVWFYRVFRFSCSFKSFQISQIIWRRMVGSLVKNVMERSWKESVMPQFGLLTCQLPAGTEKNHESPLGGALKPRCSKYQSGEPCSSIESYVCQYCSVSLWGKQDFVYVAAAPNHIAILPSSVSHYNCNCLSTELHLSFGTADVRIYKQFIVQSSANSLLAN